MYTELADAEADGYTVTLNADDAMVAEIIDDAGEGFGYAMLRFCA